MPRTKTQFCLAALTLLVIAAHFFYFWKVRTGVPHQDDWPALDEMFQSIDSHRIADWIFSPRNGHFAVPARLSYLFALKVWDLDLTPLRFVNFLVCAAAFLLTVHVINAHLKQTRLRYYLYLGTSLVIFSLCIWEHFTQAGAFTTLLSTLFGGIGLYFIARSTQPKLDRGNDVASGTAWIVASILSFGTGYPAVAATVAVFLLVGFKIFAKSHPRRSYKHAIFGLFIGIAVVTILAYPPFGLGTRISPHVLHFLLVAGSIGAFPFEDGVIAQNAWYLFGVVLFGLVLWALFDFLVVQPARPQLLPVFSIGLVLFGLFCCIAVAMARWRLPAGEFLSSRYTLYPSVCFLGLILYSAAASRFMLGQIWSLVGVAYLIVSVKEQQVGRYRPAVYHTIEGALRNVDSMSDEQLAGALYWRETPEQTRRVAVRLRNEHLNVFRATR